MAVEGRVVPRLADHFPRVPKQCEKVSSVFFECFTAASKQEEGVPSTTKGEEGLAACVRQMQKYDA